LSRVVMRLIRSFVKLWSCYRVSWESPNASLSMLVTNCPERWWMSHPWRHPRSGWRGSEQCDLTPWGCTSPPVPAGSIEQPMHCEPGAGRWVHGQAVLITACSCLFPNTLLKECKCPAGDSVCLQQSGQTKQRAKQNTHHKSRMVFIVSFSFVSSGAPWLVGP